MESEPWKFHPEEKEIQDLTTSEKPCLIPGLPDDIALSCLARVPRRCYPVLNCVSSRWRELVTGDEWHRYRRKHHLEETWLYALCRDDSFQLCLYVLDPDHVRRGWRRIHGLPDRCLSRRGFGFEVLGRKIYLFGGCRWAANATDEVYCYDALVKTWTRANSLSTARCFFAYEAFDGKIYAIGGLGPESSNMLSCDVYDSCTNSWSFHGDPSVVTDIEDSVVFDGKIYIRCGSSAVYPYVHAVLYEPSSGTWQHVDADMASGWRGPAVVVDDNLYVLDQSSGARLMMWRKASREWVAMRRLSLHLVKPPCRLMAIGKKIFVVGRGLGTVMFDVGYADYMDGVSVSSSVLKLTCDVEVFSCKSLAI